MWQLAGLDKPQPLRTTFTIGADSPEAMAATATEYVEAKSIKVKLTGDVDLDVARVAAIRAARPDVWLGVDGNQGYTRDGLVAILPALARLDVRLVEQPLARGHDPELAGIGSPIPLAGDESICCLADVAGAVGRFDVINIKLDKCGGLTEGLLMVAEARRLGLGVMVGPWSALASPPHLASSSGRSPISSISTARLSSSMTSHPASSTATAPCGRARRSGDRQPRHDGGHRHGTDLVRPAARPDRPLPDQYVGAVLILRMRALLVYYMTKSLLFGQGRASFIYGAYTACAYFTPIVGGVIADRWLL